MLQYIKEIKTCDELNEITENLRIIAANEKSIMVLKLIEQALNRSEDLNNKKASIDLKELQIKQLYGFSDKITIIEKMLFSMKSASEELNYLEGIILSYSIEWGIEKYKGNEELSHTAIQNAMSLLEKHDNLDDYVYNVCRYSYAIDAWLEKHDPKSGEILEECFSYFVNRGIYKGAIHSLGYLSLIYFHISRRKEAIEIAQKFLESGIEIEKLSDDLQGFAYYFLGVVFKLDFQLFKAEKNFIKAKQIFESNVKENSFSSYHIIILSHLTATYSLQGKLELSLKQMKEVEELIEEGIATKNLDSFSKRQIRHDFNLTKFYIKSRLQSFRIEDLHELVQIISDNIEKHHSDSIFFSEFLLNADLTKEQLIKMKNLNNPSTKRIEHIINFLIEKTTHTDEQQIMKWISALKRRPVEERMTFVEKAYADLLAAQEYYKINRFAEIYQLLKKYENQHHKIEVLEMRVFMEASIQVGAYKNGDPLGPALQYMAIKKCKQYGFSRLENKLLDYLNMQGSDTLKMLI